MKPADRPSEKPQQLAAAVAELDAFSAKIKTTIRDLEQRRRAEIAKLDELVRRIPWNEVAEHLLLACEGRAKHPFAARRNDDARRIWQRTNAILKKLGRGHHPSHALEHKRNMLEGMIREKVTNVRHALRACPEAAYAVSIAMMVVQDSLSPFTDDGLRIAQARLTGARKTNQRKRADADMTVARCFQIAARLPKGLSIRAQAQHVRRRWKGNRVPSLSTIQHALSQKKATR